MYCQLFKCQNSEPCPGCCRLSIWKDIFHVKNRGCWYTRQSGLREATKSFNLCLLELFLVNSLLLTWFVSNLALFSSTPLFHCSNVRLCIVLIMYAFALFSSCTPSLHCYAFFALLRLLCIVTPSYIVIYWKLASIIIQIKSYIILKWFQIGCFYCCIVTDASNKGGKHWPLLLATTS